MGPADQRDLLGADGEAMSDEELAQSAEQNNVFAG